MKPRSKRRKPVLWVVERYGVPCEYFTLRRHAQESAKRCNEATQDRGIFVAVPYKRSR